MKYDGSTSFIPVWSPLVLDVAPLSLVVNSPKFLMLTLFILWDYSLLWDNCGRIYEHLQLRKSLVIIHFLRPVFLRHHDELIIFRDVLRSLFFQSLNNIFWHPTGLVHVKSELHFGVNFVHVLATRTWRPRMVDDKIWLWYEYFAGWRNWSWRE